MGKLYRVLDDLSIGKGRVIKRGTISALSEISESILGILLKRGAVAEVASPPLSVLPGGWEKRAKRLGIYGISTIEEFLCANSAEIAANLKVKEGTVETWKREARKFMLVEDDGEESKKEVERNVSSYRT